ncbi:rhomboid family intramembrane serine protease [Oceanihabitans sp. IOP_32]|uniref:rhomboid family intramembrane serine protease n=1 Tax=Oceanihabitans sp. IOP_32 TaxID=2529032 RepID=UPI001293B44A|nr:rhomboid family intramembrane serine protease [Oceanihabitans sp. IOP_32]QFZ55261.1 rhomboid family intramembrane serine protease [Oceanihabitans sp. IOP_32]
MIRISDTVKHLLIINVLMFIGTLFVGKGILFYDLFAMHFPANEAFKPWQIITHMFMHGGADLNNFSIMHLLFNMFALWMFGTPVEQVLGKKKFLFIYFSAGLGALALQLGSYYFDYYAALSGIADLNMSSEMLTEIVSIDASDGQYIKGEILSREMMPILAEYNFNPNLINNEAFKSLFEMNVISRNTMVGASGCIMGVLAAFGMMNPNAELMLIFLPIPIKAKYFIPGIILLDLISGITGQSFFSPSNTAYFAHVGGALVGFLIMWYWKKTQFNKNRWY